MKKGWNCLRIWNTKIMEHKGYIGEFSFDDELSLFQGKVANIKDIILFQGKSIETLRYAFIDAVNEYLAWCQKNGRHPEIPSNDNSESIDDLYSA